MGYFPNHTAWECWASENCFKCAHWPRTDEAEPCPVEMAHTLYNYNADEGTPLKFVLDMLIPQHGIETGRCAMFHERHAGMLADEERQERIRADIQRYEAAIAEMRKAA